MPDRVFLFPPSCPMRGCAFFRPRLLAAGVSSSSISRNSLSELRHCVISARVWTRIRVLTLRTPIRYAATTVFPKAVAADRTPVS